jgi:uncharacterized coiled-coil protein SlyX
MSDPVDQIAGWAPVKLITAALGLVVGWLFKIILGKAKDAEARIAALELRAAAAEKAFELAAKDLLAAANRTKDNAAEIAILDKRFDQMDKDLATRTMLGAMGDRLDGRITNIAQDQAVLKTLVNERTKSGATRK